ncbi:hypothetical protein BKA80DRAFT_22183 [Phyllosticta citrichinensis]
MRKHPTKARDIVAPYLCRLGGHSCNSKIRVSGSSRRVLRAWISPSGLVRGAMLASSRLSMPTARRRDSAWCFASNAGAGDGGDGAMTGGWRAWVCAGRVVGAFVVCTGRQTLVVREVGRWWAGWWVLKIPLESANPPQRLPWNIWPRVASGAVSDGTTKASITSTECPGSVLFPHFVCHQAFRDNTEYAQSVKCGPRTDSAFN